MVTTCLATYILSFSFADKTVAMSQIAKEDEFVSEAFERLLMPSRQMSKMNIVETPEMHELYETVVLGSDDHEFVFLRGPPGLGKTTSLFWLYKQLQQLQGFFTVVIPFQTLDDRYEYVSSQVKQCPSTSKLILLMDLWTPSVECTKQKRCSLKFTP